METSLKQKSQFLEDGLIRARIGHKDMVIALSGRILSNFLV